MILANPKYNARDYPIIRVGQNHSYIQCTYGIFGLGITKYTVYIYICTYMYGSGQPYL